MMSLPSLFTSSPPKGLPQNLLKSYRPDFEFLDGILEERKGGEWEHALLLTSIGTWFANREAEWNIRAVMSYSMLVSPTRIRIADLCVVPNDGANERVRITPPLLCVEILSLDDSLTQLLGRFEDYVQMGVPNLWLIDSSDRTTMVYTAHGLKLFEGSRLTIKNTPIYLDLPEIFSALD